MGGFTARLMKSFMAIKGRLVYFSRTGSTSSGRIWLSNLVVRLAKIVADEVVSVSG
jgi:hypothetical protein